MTKRSGKSIRVERRQACSHRLREALYHWARVAAQHDAVSKARYAALRARGHTHGRALRGVGDRLLAVACAMLKTQTTFEPRLPKIAGTQPQNSPSYMLGVPPFARRRRSVGRWTVGWQNVGRQFMVVNEKWRCPIWFYLPFPGGRWRTTMARPQLLGEGLQFAFP